jgi:hypothetical protein
VIVGFEATGNYHRPLAYRLLEMTRPTRPAGWPEARLNYVASRLSRRPNTQKARTENFL